MLLKDKYDLPVEEVTAPPRYDAVGQCLLDAAERIRSRGWCQKRLCAMDGSLCLVGAIFGLNEEAEGMLPFRKQLSEVESKARVLMEDNDFGPDWNDAPGRTKEEVIAALETIAATRIVK